MGLLFLQLIYWRTVSALIFPIIWANNPSVSINEAVGDMIEYLADTFNSNATLLKGRIIMDGTCAILVGIHLTLMKNTMKAKGDIGKEHKPINASVQKSAINVFLDTAQSP